MSDEQGPKVADPIAGVSDPLSNDVERRTWDEFRESGMLWAMNTILHWFGWAIVVVTDDADPSNFGGAGPVVLGAQPVRTKWRGFPAENNDRGIARLTEWMASAGPSLREDIKD
jgi:hypothetical protein